MDMPPCQGRRTEGLGRARAGGAAPRRWGGPGPAPGLGPATPGAPAQASATRLPLRRRCRGSGGRGEDKAEEKEHASETGRWGGSGGYAAFRLLPLAAPRGLAGVFVFVEGRENAAHAVPKIFKADVEPRCKRESHLAAQVEPVKTRVCY